MFYEDKQNKAGNNKMAVVHRMKICQDCFNFYPHDENDKGIVPDYLCPKCREK